MPVEFDPERHCGAKLRSGARCRHPKGFRVPGRKGIGQCWLHGGIASKGNRTHGIYAKVKVPRIQELLTQIENTEHDVMDLVPEAQLCRAMTLDYLERYGEMSEALLTWHTVTSKALSKLEHALERADGAAMSAALDEMRAAHQDRPQKILDISAVSILVDRIGRTVERIHKIRLETSVTSDQLKFIFEAQARIMGKYLEEATLKRILKDYEKISWI